MKGEIKMKLMDLQMYFELGWVVVESDCLGDAEYSIAEGDEFSDLSVGGFDDEAVERVEFDDESHRIILHLLDSDEM